MLLNQTSKLIPANRFNSLQIKKDIKAMLAVAHGEQKDKNGPILVGLAAPQIGIAKRIILVDVGANGKGKVGNLRIYINPEIIWQSKEQNEWYEGCFSTGNVCGIVSRSTRIKIRGFSLQPSRLPRKVEEEYGGYVARIFQHEIDHLNGIRFPDLITDPEKLHWVEKDEFKSYRDRESWRSWPKKFALEKWTNLKITQLIAL